MSKRGDRADPIEPNERRRGSSSSKEERNKTRRSPSVLPSGKVGKMSDSSWRGGGRGEKGKYGGRNGRGVQLFFWLGEREKKGGILPFCSRKKTGRGGTVAEFLFRG